MTAVTLIFNPPSPPPDADEDVLASVLRDDGSIEVWEANFDGQAWRTSNATTITSPVVSWAQKPAGVDLCDITREHPDQVESAEVTTDWKAIASELSKRVHFAIVNCQCQSGGLMNLATGTFTSWREYMAQGLEMVPGVEIDREILATLSLPTSKRKKAQAEIKARRANTQARDTP